MTADKGVILEIQHGRAVLLTPGGRFVRLPVQATSWAIGHEVAFTEPDAGASAVARIEAHHRGSLAPRRAAFAWTRMRVAAMAAMLALVLAVPGIYAYANRPLPALAYVSVDINPGVDLGVDARGRVVTAEATNQDGQTVLTQTQVLRLQLEQALKNLTEAAIKAGFLTDQNSLVVVAAVPVKSGATLPPALSTTIEQAKAGAQRLLDQKNLGAVVQTIVTDATVREDAKSHNLSVGKYVIYLEAKNEGLPITVQELQKGVGQAIKKAGGQVGEIAGKAHERKDFKELGEKFKKSIEDEEKENAEEAQKAQKAQEAGKGKPEGEAPMKTTDNGKQVGEPEKGRKPDSQGEDAEGKETDEHGGDKGEPEGKGGPQPGGTTWISPNPPGQTTPGQTSSPGKGGALDKPKDQQIAYKTKRPNEPDRSFGFLSLDDRSRAGKRQGPR
ncbi:MAG: anti-sigma-I factor RsgI family protein [Bacillota bacterium]